MDEDTSNDLMLMMYARGGVLACVKHANFAEGKNTLD
jgi:hypothetical protein